MMFLCAYHCYLGGERKSEASVLQSSSVIAAAAGSFEGDLSSGMLVFVLPAYEA